MKAKILMIGLTSPLEGGSQRAIYELSKKINCDVLTQKGSICENKIEINAEGGSEFMSHISFAINAFIYSIFILMLGKKKYDIIHIHENLLYFLAPILYCRYNIVVTVHGMKGFKFYDNKILWFFFSAALEYSDRIIAVSKADMDLLKQKGFNDVIYIPNGVDLSLYGKVATLIDNKIVYIGRIHEQKGIDLLLAAKPKGINLEIIGDNTNEYAKELMSIYSNDKEIIWLGKIDDRKKIVGALETASLIVLPSRWEGMPLTLFESLASGRPVIVSDIPAYKSIVTDKEVLFFSSNNIEDLKQKIFKALSNIYNDEFLNIGLNGKELAKQSDWTQIAYQTMKAYGKYGK